MPTVPHLSNGSKENCSKESHGNYQEHKPGTTAGDVKIQNLVDENALRYVAALSAIQDSSLYKNDDFKSNGSNSLVRINTMSNEPQSAIEVLGRYKTGVVNSFPIELSPNKRQKISERGDWHNIIPSVGDVFNNVHELHKINKLPVSLNTTNNDAVRHSLQLLLGNHLAPFKSSIDSISFDGLNKDFFAGKMSLLYGSPNGSRDLIIDSRHRPGVSQGAIGFDESARKSTDLKEMTKRENNRRNAARARKRSKEFLNRLKQTVEKLTNQILELKRENEILRSKVDSKPDSRTEVHKCSTSKSDDSRSRSNQVLNNNMLEGCFNPIPEVEKSKLSPEIQLEGLKESSYTTDPNLISPFLDKATYPSLLPKKSNDVDVSKEIEARELKQHPGPFERFGLAASNSMNSSYPNLLIPPSHSLQSITEPLCDSKLLNNDLTCFQVGDNDVRCSQLMFSQIQNMYLQRLLSTSTIPKTAGIGMEQSDANKLGQILEQNRFSQGPSMSTAEALILLMQQRQQQQNEQNPKI